MALILVIDDEQVVCDMLSTILARYGYEVETAEDGASALALFAARREEMEGLWREAALAVAACALTLGRIHLAQLDLFYA